MVRLRYILLALLPALLAATPPEGGSRYAGDKSEYGGYRFAHGSAAVIDTVTILWCKTATLIDGDWDAGDTAHPAWPSSAPDKIFHDNAGDVIRFAQIQRSSPTDAPGGYNASSLRMNVWTEDDMPTSGQRHGFIWVDLDEIPQGSTILDGKLGLTNYTVSAIDIDGTGDYICAYADTCSADEAWLSAAKYSTSRLRDASWNYADATKATAWSSSWTDRDYLYELGVPSEQWTTTIATNGTVSFDLTHQVQFLRDEDAPFAGWIVNGDNSSAENIYWHLQNEGTSSNADKEPFVVVTYTTKTYSEPAYDVLLFNDNHARAAFYAEDIDSIVTALEGVTFEPDLVIHNGDQNYLATVDSVWTRGQCDAMFGTDVPVLMGTGNHEVATAADAGMMASLTIDNIEAINEATDFRVSMLGQLATSYNLRYNSLVLTRGDVSFILFDPSLVESDHTWEAADTAWLYAAVNSVKSPTKLIFMHHPPWKVWDIDTLNPSATTCFEDSTALRSMANAAGVTGVFSGHIHNMNWKKYDNVWYVGCPTAKTDDSDFETMAPYAGFMVLHINGTSVSFDTYRKIGGVWKNDHTVELE